MQEYYKLPTAEHRRLALGSLPGTSYRVRKALEQVIPFFEPMSQPKPGQWLWDHEEQGQTYDAYVGQMHNQVNEKRNIIYIKPLQNIDKHFLNTLRDYCECFYHPLKVVVLPGNAELLKPIKKRINQYTQKQQLHAKEILVALQKKLPKDGFCLIGVCMTDLYPREEWNYVFGLASIRQRTGVFSFARYDQRFFQQKQYEADYDRILWRSISVMVHEITHMFGVRHCIFYRCLMNGSNHLEESCSKPLELCAVCLRKLQSNIHFDILERYQRIHGYLQSKKDQRMGNFQNMIQEIIANIRGSLKEEAK